MKKELKKVLLLVLVLAMVLSTCIFAFAGGEYALLGDNLQEEEVLHGPPITAYEEKIALAWPQIKQVDLSRATSSEAQGTVEYTVTGNLDILQETVTPGVYDLTGELNSNGDPAIVTAAYYSPGKSSATDEPRFTTSINVYVKPESEDYAVFDGYDVFDLSEMTYEMDEAFVLPYYSIASERETYGIIDLGLTEKWKNATVTFSNPAKFEYLGDGRIRALASHTWTEAGGTQEAVDANTTANAYTGTFTFDSKRDQMSMGTPVVMTVTALDGGVRKFGLWSFPTTVQGEGADPNAYQLNVTATSMSNAVVGVEVYDAAGNFTPTYKDPNSWRTYIGHADHRYTNTHSQPSMGQNGCIYIPLTQGSYWERYLSNKQWPGWIGLAQTFTAPKDGIIDLTGYFPADGRYYNASSTQYMVNNNKFFNLSVGLYDTDGTLISKVWQQKYGTRDANATSWGRLADTKIIDGNYAIVANDAAETLIVEVKKGQKLRVMIDTEISDGGNYVSWENEYAIKPVWTYYEETFTTSPMADYEEETELVYPQTKQADLTRAIVNPEAKGTIEYTVSGNPDILKETATPGVYDLAGKTTSADNPAIVTAAYYSPFESSAKGDAPRFTTSTKVYVKPASEGVAVFDGYDVFDLSEMTYEMDEALILPYYSIESEREKYGIIDLGLTDPWKDATVTISNPDKFEYLGDGRIRVLASHTWTEAGGVFKAEDANTTVKSYGGQLTLTSKRDQMSMGTPVVMTVTAIDGGVKKFGLWSFPTTVQGEGADPNVYKLNVTATSMSNAVVGVEVYDAAGNFTPTYKDPSSSNTFIPNADHRYTKVDTAPTLDSQNRILLPLYQASYWNSYSSNKEWPGWIGVAQTFTAPKSGLINLTGYFPADGYYMDSGITAIMVDNQKYFNLSVGLYDTDGTLISKVWQQKYGTTDKTATAWGRMGTPSVDANYATCAGDEAETLSVEVKKGQKLRVMIDTEITTPGRYSFWSGNYTIKPVWTYYEEPLSASPMADYDEETVLLWPRDEGVDLSRATSSEAQGTVVYTVTGNLDILQETVTPGVYGLTGEFNSNDDPAIVTAAYYSPYTSPANGDEPRFTTSTKVYVRLASMDSDTFVMAPNFKTTGLGLDFDSYQLPYYSNATERAMYGEIDLGFTDDWKNSIVTFSVDGKFEYLGNGRIRAIARHNYVDAGRKSVDSSVKYVTSANFTVTAFRDTNTIGSPVVMTVTAPDGGVRKFGLWSFDAQVQSAAGNSYTYSATTPFANDVVAMEAVVADGTFQKMLPDSGAGGYIAIPTADVKFEEHITSFRLSSAKWQFGDPGAAYWKGYDSHPDYAYVDYDGLSTAFTAPKDGNLTVSTLWPVLGAKGSGSSSWTSSVLSSPMSHEIRVYNADGTYETKYTVVYEADPTTSNLCLFNTIKSQTLGTNAIFDNKETADIADDTVTFDVKKGQIVRVLLTTKASNNANSVGVAFADLPFPTFTYNQTTADAMGDTIVATPVVGDATLTADNVLALIYNAAGELVQTAKGNDVTVVDGKVSVNVTDSNAAYAKLFFFESLENVRPIASDIVVRK